MHPVIDQIIRLSGEMPDVQKHRRYLETLSLDELEQRAKALRNDGRPAPDVEFWGRRRNPQRVEQFS